MLIDNSYLNLRFCLLGDVFLSHCNFVTIGQGTMYGSIFENIQTIIVLLKFITNAFIIDEKCKCGGVF